MSRITTCPHCAKRFRVSEQITDKTLICPHCLADVDNAAPGNQIRAADINTDVKRDLRVGTIVLAVLIGFCVLGITTAFSGMFSSINALKLMVISSAALAVLLIIAIIRWMVHQGRSGGYIPIVAGVLGITLIIVALVLVSIVAGVLFLIFACSEGLAPFTGGH